MSFSAFLTVAPYDCNEAVKGSADIVCTGEHDELTLQKAIDRAAEEGKSLYLLSGHYHIDGFYDRGDGGPKTAICFRNSRRETTIIGQDAPFHESGAVLYVRAHVLDALPDATDTTDEDANVQDTARNPVDVMRSTWVRRGLGSGASLHMENICFELSHNQKPIRCLDLRRCDRVDMKNMQFYAYRDMPAGLGKPPAIPAKGCIGITTTDGSNYSYSNYTNVGVSGFWEGFQVGGEHVVLINCNAIMNYYGYTFGNYSTNCGSNHPITLINCMDERNVCLPLFRQCGDSDGKGGRLQGLQEVTMVSFNIERIAEQSPGGVLKDCMREVYPGTWRGNIEFSAQPAWCHRNEVHFQLWQNDGSGSGFRTRNSCHKLACSTEERLSYYPTYCQQIYDTDLKKSLICIDPANKTWVDAMGNEV